MLSLLFALLGTGLTTVEAKPQRQGNSLDFGLPVSGTIDDVQFRLLYSFVGREGQVVTVTMSTTQGDLDPYVLIMNTSGVVIAASDDDGANNDAVIGAMRLPSDNDYFVVATRFGVEHGTTSGSFELLLENNGNSAIASATLNIGNSVVDQLNNETYERIYSFPAVRGQVVNIQLKRTSGDLDPLLDLFDADGNLLEMGDDDPTNPNSLNAGIINFLIPTNGVYYIRATRYGREGGSSVGTFQLIVTETPVENLGTRPGNARLLVYDEATTGGIDQEIFTRFFQFKAERGDVISVIVNRESGNIAPQVSLLNTDLRTLSSSPDQAAVAEARIPGASIPETGTYYVLVSRYRGAEGTSEGEFSIQLNGRAGIGGTNALEIIYGAQVSGVIDDTKFIEDYLFVGDAGDRIIITMEQLEGDLDCLLTLRDANGKQLAFNDDAATGNQDARIEFTLAEDGIYTIEASRFEKNEGSSSGIYALTLDQR